MWVTRRKYKRQSPGAAVFSRVGQHWLDVLVFAGAQAESSDGSAVNSVGIEWVGLDVTVFDASLDGTPVVRVQRRIQTPAGRGGGAAVLLHTVNAVRKTAVGDHVVELAGGLVVPRTPRLAAVHGDDGTLIAAENHALRFIGINPQKMIIVAAGRAFDGREALPAIARTIERSVGHINCVGIFRVHGNVGKIPAASPDARIAVGPPPVRSGVVGAVEPAFPGVHDQINPLRV